MAARYGDPHCAPEAGGRVLAVADDSPAARAGVLPGDLVLEADGERMTDILAWEWAAADDEVTVTLQRSAAAPTETTLAREPGQSWGLSFGDLVFDGVRECDNACAFCFVGQLPEGLRDSLYVRDDDYRLSFLTGNFITLTNLSEDDIARIVRMRLSPLYVSVHAVSPDARARVVCATGDDRALETMDRLLADGIEMHAQVVAVPGMNDGEELERTLAWLAEREGVVSVGVVPVGYTGHQSRIDRSYERTEDAAALLEQIEPWQHRMRDERGVDWVYAADELYLNAGRQLPRAEDYDGYPQYENGIGIARDFLDGLAAEAGELADDLEEAPWPNEVVLVSGRLFGPHLEAALTRIPELGGRVRVLEVDNVLFGGNVNVTGLLAGTDIAEAVRADAESEQATHAGGGAGVVYLLPDIVLNSEGLTLDGIAAAELPGLTGADVRLVSSDAAGLAEALRDLAWDVPRALEDESR